MIHRKEERTKKRGRENQSNKDESIKHIRKQITTEAEIIKQKKKDRNQQSAVADPGGGAAPPPYFWALWTKLRSEGPKKIFWETAPPSPYLKVWIRR